MSYHFLITFFIRKTQDLKKRQIFLHIFDLVQIFTRGVIRLITFFYYDIQKYSSRTILITYQK